MSLKCSTIMLSAAKVKMGCTKSRYTPEVFLLNNINISISYSERAYALPPAEAARVNPEVRVLRGLSRMKATGL